MKEGFKKKPEVIGVVGAGIMGRGIAQAFIQCGHQTILIDQSEQVLDSARESIIKGLFKLTEIGKISDKERRSFEKKLELSKEIKYLGSASLVIEAIPEDLDLKQAFFLQLSRVVSKHAVLATNTSTLSIHQVFKKINGPQRAIGLHFFNPAEKMKLVEVIPSDLTSRSVVKACMGLMKEIHKVPILCKDCPGFIINRLLLLTINEALKMAAAGIAKPEDIDTAAREGLNHRMGPFELADLIGLDLLNDLLHILAKDLGPRYLPPELLPKMVQEGKLGVKSCKGFYDY